MRKSDPYHSELLTEVYEPTPTGAWQRLRGWWNPHSVFVGVIVVLGVVNILWQIAELWF